LAGCPAGELFEPGFKISEAPESEVVADLGDGVIGGFFQQFFGFFNPNESHIFMIWHADNPVKKPAEMIFAQARSMSNCFEAESLLIMLMDKFDGPLDAQMRQ
jgi:hypothetical protein